MAVPQVDVARARAFVLAHGGAVDVARMEGILGRTEPDRAVVRALERLQNSDGGFPVAAVARGAGAALGTTAAGGHHEGQDTIASGGRAGARGAADSGASSIAVTCQVLAHLRDIPPLAGSPMASRAVAFLRRSQSVDGSWSAAQEGVDPALLTASAAYTLAVLEPDHPDPIVRAARWLRRTLADGAGDTRAEGTEHSREGGPGRVAALGSGSDRSAALFRAAAVWGHSGDAAAQDSAYALLEQRDLTAPEIAGWLATFVELGLAARHFALAFRLLGRLAGLQQTDGSWPVGEGSAVEATLAALRVFRGFRLVGE